jgi:hypothetical protein
VKKCPGDEYHENTEQVDYSVLAVCRGEISQRNPEGFLSVV